MKYKKYILIFSAVILIFIVFKFLSPNLESKLFAQELLNKADININGNRPWDIVIHNENFYTRVLNEGSLGLGESYMDGWWDCQDLDQFFYKLLSADLDKSVKINFELITQILKAKILNLQSENRAFEVGEQHYDLSNDLFRKMLDSKMIYSCGYWNKANNLEQAQENKLDLICKKLNLKPGMKVLDIGCGWCGLARYMAEKYKVNVVGITISKEQAKYSQEICKKLPVQIMIKDYRELNETFDRIVSVGMFEHVGYKNYKEFMKIVNACLKDNGLFLLHTIGGNKSEITCDPWILKYIFPNGMLPSIAQIATASEELFVMEDWHNFSVDYDKTLMAWYNNFEKNWDSIKSNYNNRFHRMWKYYLLCCAGFFRARKGQLWQIIFSKKGISQGYQSIR